MLIHIININIPSELSLTPFVKEKEVKSEDVFDE